MNNPSDAKETAFLIFRLVCVAGFFISLYGGYYLHRNFNRLFGVNPNLPSESAGARGYSKMQVMAVWLHIVLFFLMGALLLH